MMEDTFMPISAPAMSSNVGVRRHDPLLKMLDDYRRDEPDLPTRASALRRLAIIGLDALKRGKQH